MKTKTAPAERSSFVYHESQTLFLLAPENPPHFSAVAFAPLAAGRCGSDYAGPRFGRPASAGLRGTASHISSHIHQSHPCSPSLASNTPPRLSALLLRSGPEHRSPAMLLRQAGSFAFGKRPVFLALHGARATPLPGCRWPRSSQTARRPFRAGSPPQEIPRGLRRRSRAAFAVSQTAHRISSSASAPPVLFPRTGTLNYGINCNGSAAYGTMIFEKAL